MGKMEGRVRTETSQGQAEKGHRSPSDERSRKEEIVGTHEGALGRKAKGKKHRYVIGCIPRVFSNVFLFLQKTREWRDEWPVCGSRAFVRREGTHVDALGSCRQPLDPVAETTRFSLRIPDALRARQPGPPHLPYQHDGHAYAESPSGPAGQPV